jgi:hypothetical protein
MSYRKWWSAFVVALMIAAPAFAQVDQGRFTGTVRDQSNAFVGGATIKVKNERTGEERVVLTNAQGYFLVGSLRPSTYTIRAEKDGFAAIEYTGMPVAVGQELSLDFEFKPAGVQEAVTVIGTAPVVDMSSARVGVNVGERDVNNLPVNGRQMSQLMLQAPGSQNAGTGTWQDIRFSGRAVEQNAIRYDGIEGSAIIDSAPGNLNGEIPTPFKLQASLENVQEFRIESNNYPAEHGTGTGGQVNVVTKSGSNAFHGSVFEYLRNDALDAPNYFDTFAGLPKSTLEQHQFGGSVGGPIAKNRAFFFGSFEGYNLNAGFNAVEAVPSAAAWARAVPAVAVLRPGFMSQSAVILPGKSNNPDFDIAQLQGLQEVRENSFSARVDFKLSNSWSTYVRVFHDQGKSDQPEGVSGRVVHIQDNPTNAIFNLQGVMSDKAINEFKFGYNSAPSNIIGQAPIINGIDFNSLAINLSGSVANTGIAGQGQSSGIVVPGGLVRANSATNGHAQPYDPYSLTAADTFSYVTGSHYAKLGGEFRGIRMATDRIGGTTYSYAGLTQFLANQASSVQYLGNLSAPSPFNNGATGERHTVQNYFIGFAQDEWRPRPSLTMNFGVRYDYYAPLSEADNLIVKWNIDTGVIDTNTTPLYTSKKSNFQPRVSLAYAPGKTVFKTGFGIFVGPGQTEDQIQPVESDRVSSTLSNSAYPIDPAVLTALFTSTPNNRQYQPRAYANEYTIPERIYQYTASVQQELPGRMAATVAYVGSTGHNLFLRSVANQIVGVYTNPNPANAAVVVREWSIVTARDAAGNPTAVQNPYAEVDYKTSGGHDSYNAMMVSLSKRSSTGLSLNVQYTLGKSYGNTAGSNEALTSGNLARNLSAFDYDNGYNNFDVRHTFNLSALYQIPYGRNRVHSASGFSDAILGGWDIGGIINARSGLPVNVLVTRPDVVYLDAAGNVFSSPLAGRTAVINTPGGGASRNVRRPDLIPGVDPFIQDGGLLFLNPAAFAAPKPGTYGNLERNSLHGPSFRQVDFVASKHWPFSPERNVEFRFEVFNLFNTANFTNPVGTLPLALPATSLTEANRVQPGQPYTAAAAGTFGTITSTVGRTVGLGTSRQIQFALRLNF